MSAESLPVRLDVGCGGEVKPGWIGVDAYHVGENGIIAPMWNLPFSEGAVDEIYSSHALEHVLKRDVEPTLREWFRVLKPGGVLTLLVPDLEWCVRHWLKHQNSRGWELDILFGNQSRAGEVHQTGFTETTLRTLLESVSFRVWCFTRIPTHGQQTLSFLAEKPRVVAFK